MEIKNPKEVVEEIETIRETAKEVFDENLSPVKETIKEIHDEAQSCMNDCYEHVMK